MLVRRGGSRELIGTRHRKHSRSGTGPRPADPWLCQRPVTSGGVAGGDGHRVPTLDLIDRQALTLLACTDDIAWRAACATMGPRAPIIVRALDANCAIRLGIGRHGATLVRPDAIPIWLTTEPADAADRLERTVRAYLRPPTDADALPERHVKAGSASLARPA
jgi:hypothetical protein